MKSNLMREAPVINVRDQPAYSIVEGARYIKIADATLRSWVVGRAYPKGAGTARFEPLIRRPADASNLLSFWNLIEAHVLRALRTKHGVSIRALRTAITYAEAALGIDRLLLSKELRTDGGRLLLERYGELIELSASGQLAMRVDFEAHLARVEWDDAQIPVRLYPFVSSTSLEPRSLAIDPAVAFGRPILVSRSISTQSIVDRIDAGETAADVAADYELGIAEVEEAVLYERAA